MPTKKKEDTAGNRGPWWVTNSSGAQFATYRMAEGLKDTGESPFKRDGETLRAAIPAGASTAANPAQTTTEGIVP